MFWRHGKAFMLPVTVACVVPALLACAFGVHTLRQWIVTLLLSGLGLTLATFGMILLLQTNFLFHRRGHGTLAPWDPPKRLVIEGPYRYARNPMITGVCLIVLGESALLQSLPIFIWFGLFSVAQTIYIRFHEEKELVERFGQAYESYCNEVPRLIPRPWRRPSQGTVRRP